MGPHPAHCPERTETGLCHHDLPQGHGAPSSLWVGFMFGQTSSLQPPHPGASCGLVVLCPSSQVSHGASQQDHREGAADETGAGDPLRQCVTNSTPFHTLPLSAHSQGLFLSLCRPCWPSDLTRFPRDQWGSQLGLQVPSAREAGTAWTSAVGLP